MQQLQYVSGSVAKRAVCLIRAPSVTGEPIIFWLKGTGCQEMDALTAVNPLNPPEVHSWREALQTQVHVDSSPGEMGVEELLTERGTRERLRVHSLEV